MNSVGPFDNAGGWPPRPHSLTANHAHAYWNKTRQHAFPSCLWIAPDVDVVPGMEWVLLSIAGKDATGLGENVRNARHVATLQCVLLSPHRARVTCAQHG
jgi:hypothetical protein